MGGATLGQVAEHEPESKLVRKELFSAASVPLLASSSLPGVPALLRFMLNSKLNKPFPQEVALCRGAFSSNRKQTRMRAKLDVFPPSALLSCLLLRQDCATCLHSALHL